MAEHPPEKFKFRVDDAHLSEPVYPGRAQDQRQGGRLKSILLIALLLIIIAAFALAFYDLKSQLQNSQSSGSMEVTNLSKDLESRFSSLSLRQAKLEDLLGKQIEAFEQASTALKSDQELLKNRLKESEDNLVSLNQELDAKSDTKNVSKQIKRLSASLAPLDAKLNKHLGRLSMLEKDLDGLNTKLQAAKEDMLGEINELSRIIDETSKNMIDQKSQLAQLAQQMVTKGALSKDLEKNKTQLRTQLDQAVAQLQSDLDQLSALEQPQDALEALQKQITTFEQEVSVLVSRISDNNREIIKINRVLKTFQAKIPMTLTPRGESQGSGSAPPSQGQNSGGADILEQDILN